MSKITTAQMREWHVRHDHTGTKPRKYYEAEFDGWLAQVRAEVLREAAESFTKGGMVRRRLEELAALADKETL